ncbi:MAG: hypothetical protein MJZ35_01180 [Bacteroidaceae bacterium]|nr:hypothetical protein [Bacteroidaceae bacterium]
MFVGMPLLADGKDKPKPPTPIKTLLKEARNGIKNKRDQGRHEQALNEALKREGLGDAEKAEIYNMLALLNISLNDGENLKAYLNQKYDTAQFFNTLLKASQYALKSDSVDAVPDAKGKQRLSYRSKNRDILLKYRSNVYNGGRFFLRRNEYQKALPYFQIFLALREAEMMQDVDIIQLDGIYPQICLYAMLSAYNLQLPQTALLYIDESMSEVNGVSLALLQEYKVRCHAALKDTVNWVKDLKEGCSSYPKHDYFFTSLAEYYENEHMYDEGLALADTLLKKVPGGKLYYYAKSLFYLHKEKWNDCIEMCDSTLARDSLNTNAIYNKGLSYMNLAMETEENMDQDIRKARNKKEKEKIAAFYKLARPPFEQLRQLLPEDKERWGRPLYRIYLNLNLGKEFAEIEKLLGK